MHTRRDIVGVGLPCLACIAIIALNTWVGSGTLPTSEAIIGWGELLGMGGVGVASGWLLRRWWALLTTPAAFLGTTLVLGGPQGLIVMIFFGLTYVAVLALGAAVGTAAAHWRMRQQRVP